MLVKPILEQKTWDEAVISLTAGFTQSWQWGEILLSEGKKIERLAVEKDGRILALAQVIYMPLPFGQQYVICPKGPVGKLTPAVLSAFKKYFTDRKIIFWRIEPNELVVGARQVADVNPSTTLILDLKQNSHSILAGMQKKTRYCLRAAQKNNLEIKTEKNLEIFWQLLNKTSRHDGFSTHAKIHYEKILKSDLSFQFTAYLNDQPISSAIFIGFEDTFTYLFSALDRDFTDTFSAYLIQWEAMVLAKKLGYTRYDFFGIAPSVSKEKYEYSRNHTYAGFTKFKLGFGGTVEESPGTFDFVLNRFVYNAYQFLRALRRIF